MDIIDRLRDAARLEPHESLFPLAIEALLAARRDTEDARLFLAWIELANIAPARVAKAIAGCLTPDCYRTALRGLIKSDPGDPAGTLIFPGLEVIYDNRVWIIRRVNRGVGGAIQSLNLDRPNATTCVELRDISLTRQEDNDVFDSA